MVETAGTKRTVDADHTPTDDNAVSAGTAFSATSPLPKRQKLQHHHHQTQLQPILEQQPHPIAAAAASNSGTNNNNVHTISVSDIVERTRRLFRQPEGCLDVIQLPCLSARLFACYTFIANGEYEGFRSCSASHQSTTSPNCLTRFEHLIRHIRPLLPFLSALVRVELMSLSSADDNMSSTKHHHQQQQHKQHNHQQQQNNEQQQQQQQQQQQRVRRVHFSGFDCSSTQPPSDACLGSHVHRQRCIDALIDAMEQAHALQLILQQQPLPPFLSSPPPPNVQLPTTTVTASSPPSPSSSPQDDQVTSTITTNNSKEKQLQLVECLQSMIIFFQDLPQRSWLVTTLAQSIHSSYPAARIGKAIDLYRNELSTILQTFSSFPTTERRDVLFVEQTLVAFLGQDIRFQLRALFNPAPYNATDKKSDNHHHTQRSLVPELVELYTLEQVVTPKGKHAKKTVVTESAVSDGMISCFVSSALQRIYDYLGRDVCLHLDQYVMDNKSTDHATSMGFCQSAASQRGLVDANEHHHHHSATTATTATNTYQEDLQMIMQDIRQAFLFLAATNASRFLLQLFHANGVEQAIQSAGGWSVTERHAQLLLRYHSSCCPEDEHFVLLAHIPKLVQVLELLASQQQQQRRQQQQRQQPRQGTLTTECQQALQDLFRRFKCNNKGRIRKRFPQIAIIANAFDDYQSLTSFPLVKSTTTTTTAVTATTTG